MSKLQIVLRYLSSKISSLAKFYEVDNKYWSLALAEFESDGRNKDLWVKCLAKSNFDEGKAKSQYMKIRAKELSETDLPSDVDVKNYIKSNMASTKERTKSLMTFTKGFPIIKFPNHYIQKFAYFSIWIILWSTLTAIFDSARNSYGEALIFLLSSFIPIYLTTVNVKRNLIAVTALVLLASNYQLFSDSRSFVESLGACSLLGLIGYFILTLIRGKLFNEKYVPSDVFSKFVIGVAIGSIFGIPIAFNAKKNRELEQEIKVEFSHIFGEVYGLCAASNHVTEKYCKPMEEDKNFVEFCTSDIVSNVLPTSMHFETNWFIEHGNFEQDVQKLLSKTDARYALETLNSNGIDVCPQFRDNLRGLFNRSMIDLSELKDKKYKLLKRLD